MISFELTNEQMELQDRVETFIRDEIIPLEQTGSPEQIMDPFRDQLDGLALSLIHI